MRGKGEEREASGILNPERRTLNPGPLPLPPEPLMHHCTVLPSRFSLSASPVGLVKGPGLGLGLNSPRDRAVGTLEHGQDARATGRCFRVATSWAGGATFSMYGYCTSTGRELRSVAWRFRQPIGGMGGVWPGQTGACRLPFFGQRRLEGSRTGPGDVPAGQGEPTRPDSLARLEAVMFLARHPQSSRTLAQLAGLTDGTEARTLVRKLNRLYDSGGSAFRVEEVAGGYQLMSRSKFAPWLRRLHSLPVEVRLSAPAMETLAVVAYRQPVLRAEVEAIRGVQCGEILRQLIERDLVRIVGRSEELGRPLLYGTSRQFLQTFGLRHLEELPRRELLQIVSPGQIGAAAQRVPADGPKTARESSNQPNHSYQEEEETNVKTATTASTRPMDLPDENAATVVQTPRSEQSDDAYTFDEHDDEGYPDDEDDLDEDDLDEDDADDAHDADEDDEQNLAKKDDPDEEDDNGEDLDEEDDDLEEDDLEEEDLEEEDEEDEEDLEDETWEEVEDDDEEEEEDEDWEEDDEDDWEEDDWEDEEEEEEEEEK